MPEPDAAGARGSGIFARRCGCPRRWGTLVPQFNQRLPGVNPMRAVVAAILLCGIAGGAEPKKTADDTRGQSPLGGLFDAATQVLSGGKDADKEKSDDDTTGNDGLVDLLDSATDGIKKVLDTADNALPSLDPSTAREYGASYRKTSIEKHGVIKDKPTIAIIVPLWNDVVKAAKEPPETLTLTLLDDPENNAYAFVGRNITVNRGFLDFAKSCAHTKDVIRFALAHELGHIVKGHTDGMFRRMHAADKIVSGASVAPAMIESVIKQTPINHAMEREADCFAYAIHKDNGWSPEGGKELFSRLAKMQSKPGKEDGLSCLFSSHPDSVRRIKLLETGTGCP